MLRALLSRSNLAHRLHGWLLGSRFHITGSGHRIERHHARLERTRIEVVGRDCVVLLGPGARLWDCSITVAGRGATLRIGAGCRLRRARLAVEDDGSCLEIGNGTSMTGPTLVAHEGGTVRLGRDCMVAQYAELRNSDSHGIYDGATGARLNPAADVLIGDHVWIGLGAFVFKGARIGDGAIIAARSLVTGPVPPACIVAGMPPRVLRENVAWRRERTAASILSPQ